MSQTHATVVTADYIYILDICCASMCVHKSRNKIKERVVTENLGVPSNH